ncbi:hypothetical protein CUT44_21410 [Streptomyces carminius]|uniref:Uncharacterized protein n=1 Tax=Streptomyces carminius TaxID=2665496 RepID=A0A2M8LV23_9ACTN|nr:hypothetical protein [Streptomyces carminius]PJE95813.1 hypothetical protein CUT44_21410 [Streptomyces carminius]
MDVAAYRGAVSTAWRCAAVVTTVIVTVAVTVNELVTGRLSGRGRDARAAEGGRDGTGPRTAPDHEAGIPAGPPLPGTPVQVPARRSRPAAGRGAGPPDRSGAGRAETVRAGEVRAEEARDEPPRELRAVPPPANPPAESRDEPPGARRRGRSPRRRPHDAGAHGVARAPAGEEGGPPPPGNFTELLDRMGEFPTLRFTGDRKVTRRLDERSMPNWIVICWNGLKALEDFAADSVAGRAGGDFRAWCRNLPPGRHPFPAGKVRMKESETVRCKSAWRRERMLPVPRAVHPSGRVYMEAHLRIGAGNAVSPRLHFHDDTAGTGLLYIGYIGPHLTNTRTT